MTYNMADRLDTLGTRMGSLHSNSLTYSRGITSVVITNFTPEKCDVNEMLALGVIQISEKLQDFAFDLADLATLSPAYPQHDDKIVWGTLTFRVTSIGDEIFRPTTSSRKRIRVHAKQVNG